MKKAILGKKVGMTQLFREDGTMIPVTVVLAGPCPVTQIKTIDRDGYKAVQMAFQPVREKLITRPQMGHLRKAGVEAHKYVKEFKLDDCDSFAIGDVIKADTFEAGERVDVTGTSNGKGLAGNIKRWYQSRGRKTHGSHSYRVAGSMGACTYPGEVFKTKHLPGHMGHERVTVQNLEVVRADAERNLLLIKGAIPGANGGLVLNPSCTEDDEEYFLDDYNDGNFPFLAKPFKYLHLAVGYNKVRDEALVEVTGTSFKAGRILGQGKKKFAWWIIVFHLGKVVNLERQKAH